MILRLGCLPSELWNTLRRPPPVLRHARCFSGEPATAEPSPPEPVDAGPPLPTQPPSPPKPLAQPYFITTPIYYVNAPPHIGHLYSSVLADILARWTRLLHPDRTVLLSTGTDEHGMKIERTAARRGRRPKIWADTHSALFRKLADVGQVGYTTFVRTTAGAHERAVSHVWNELRARGHIYKGKHVGWYSVSDECFYSPAQIEKRAGHKVSKETGQTVQWDEEENYMFRLSAFREPLIQWLLANPSLILPRARYADVLTYLSDPANCADLSISRSDRRLKWGIRVPGDPAQIVYVWLDALVNYLTAVGYPWTGGGVEEGAERGWPADVHVVGKDIVKFHAVYWPAFLMALGLPLPRQLLAHAHWTMDGRKMSKSLGNVVDPFRAMEIFGPDAVRMYLALSGGSLADDADWSWARLYDFYTARLADNIGNLLRRLASTAIVAKAAEAPYRWSAGMDVQAEVADLHARLDGLAARVEECVERRRLDWAAAVVLECISQMNAQFSQSEPWLKKTPAGRTALVQFYGLETLRIAGILLQPFMPSKAAHMLSALGVPAERRGLGECRVGAEGGGGGTGLGRGEGEGEGTAQAQLFEKFARSRYPELQGKPSVEEPVQEPEVDAP